MKHGDVSPVSISNVSRKQDTEKEARVRPFVI
jgi:hypothetical protein